MNLEDKKKKEYQGLLVKEYRKNHPEETMSLTDEEVSLMFPLNNDDIPFLMEYEKYQKNDKEDIPLIIRIGEAKRKEYQMFLVNEYRRKNPNEAIHLTDDDIALIVPLKEEDILILIEDDLLKIRKEIGEQEYEIEFTNNKLKDSKTYSNERPGLRDDIITARRRIEELESEYSKLNKIISERNMDERGTSR